MLHFSTAEFARRRSALAAEMARRNLEAMLLFAPESQYWLTGHDSFGYCFFQCLVVHPGGMHLLTRSADLRQAQLTSNIPDIRIWADAEDADPALDLRALLAEIGVLHGRVGIETATHGLTARNWIQLEQALRGTRLVEASDIVPGLRLVKSAEEIACIRVAAEIADAAWAAALPLIRGGGSEAEILAALQGEIFRRGGDYPANPVVIGSGDHALLCRYHSGRRVLAGRDQITLEWAGVWRHYHAALMRTVLVGTADARHLALHAAAAEALAACEAALKPGATTGEVFAEHARVLDSHGLSAHRLNACGYALGARFAPSWMEPQMFIPGGRVRIAPGQVWFLHMILMDSDSGAAMCLGRSSLVGENGAEPLSALPLDLEIRPAG
ncbi:MAG: Xaa-Pro dipeptidase [Paracoccaceae bacterium]|nr:MAG: aminopeptidase P family protein [Alphaproteobacteria bacterium]GIX12724.1 MAG: Xaa-Pro dipeptidase [Paracoccaceae bacterium]